MLRLAFIALFWQTTHASDCLVSDWSGWSSCYGDCHYSVQIRNRDVLIPPLPMASNGYADPPLPICPTLYETRHCLREFCENSSPIATESPYVFQTATITPENLNLIEEELNKGSLDPDSVLTLLGKKKPFYEDGQENSSVGLTSGFSSEAPEQIDDTVRTEAVTEETARIHGYINRLTIDFRDSFPKNNFKDDVKAKTESSSQVDLALINSARHSNDIVKAYKKNRKLFKALHRALNSPNYKLDQQRDAGWTTKNYESYVTSGSTVDTTLAPVVTTRQKFAPPTAKKPKSPEDDPDPELLTKDQPDVGRIRDLVTVALEKVTTPDPYRYIEQDAAVSADPGTWQRNSGYIPNTKKHASEITDMLYLTREIVQQLAADSTVAPEQSNGDCDRNPRCCKIERTICPDGTPVYYIKRYYRPIGSPVCMPYDYPACDPAVERNERPIVFEQNCQDLCFESPHRHIDPLYQLTAQ